MSTMSSYSLSTACTDNMVFDMKLGCVAVFVGFRVFIRVWGLGFRFRVSGYEDTGPLFSTPEIVGFPYSRDLQRGNPLMSEPPDIVGC